MALGMPCEKCHATPVSVNGKITGQSDESWVLSQPDHGRHVVGVLHKHGCPDLPPSSLLSPTTADDLYGKDQT